MEIHPIFHSYRNLGVDQLTENGSGLLHLAVLAQNIESVQLLINKRISPKIRDKQGLTADQVCYNPVVRKQMAPRYLQGRDPSRDPLAPSLQDKDSIFHLADSPKDFVHIQQKLQTLDFNVNTECNNAGDFLLHIAVRKGLSQLPLLMALVKIQGADIELCNADGMTPLMIAATVGNCVLCDVLICLFGADPNKPNPQSGQTALHISVEGNHRKTVECLIRRGADVNLEDHEGLRPDDIPTCLALEDDCREVIVFNRHQRLEMLTELVRKGEVVTSQLLPSDLCVVNSTGHTLVMVASIHNRFQSLHSLLEVSSSTVNAQHSSTGMTALAMAAQMGNGEVISVLMRHGANPSIADMQGYLAMHHAVLNHQEHAIDILLDHFPKAFVGLHKAMELCKRTAIHIKLKAAWEKRQDEQVTPKMLNFALNGDAGELFVLLDEGDRINPKSGSSSWPLYLAVEHGHLEVLKLLLERGADLVRVHPTTGATLLHGAARMGHTALVAHLLTYCRPEGQDTQDESLSKSRKWLDINAMDNDSKTALQLAAEKGYSGICEILLEAGATTALLDSSGQLVTCPQFEGVRSMIAAHRGTHTAKVVQHILDKSRKALPLLTQEFLPKFDHNLRTREGLTPLMVAASTGRLAVLELLLKSAVYSMSGRRRSYADEMDSDTDSGVLDQTSSSREASHAPRQLLEFSASPPISTPSCDMADDPTISPRVASPGFMDSAQMFSHSAVSRIVSDATLPQGMAIYHDGVVSHVCAVAFPSGQTALHHVVAAGDWPQTLGVLLEADPTPVNCQDVRGEAVLHLAVRLGRRKCVEMLLARPDVDVNVRTLEGHLADELTSQRVLVKLVERRRSFTPSATDLIPSNSLPSADLSMSVMSDYASSVAASTVNFDLVHSKYQALKQDSAMDRAS